MSAKFKEDNVAITYTSTRDNVEDRSIIHSVARIWKRHNHKLTFMCGDFTIEELEEVLNKIKELQSL